MSTDSKKNDAPQDETRRDFIVLSSAGMAAVGGAAVLWPFVDSMNPSADVLALASTEVGLDAVAEGQEIKVMWRGKPVFIRHRSATDIEKAREDDLADLKDPQSDAERVKPEHDQWLVMIGICTHLGCVPLGKGAGEFGGWFCPCHGSHYDTSGRIRKGPAPYNLEIPPYEFISESRIKIG